MKFGQFFLLVKNWTKPLLEKEGPKISVSYTTVYSVYTW